MTTVKKSKKSYRTSFFGLRTEKRGTFFMWIEELVKEFIFDCKVRDLSERTINGYELQLSYFVNYLKREHDIVEFNEVKPIHVKMFINGYQENNAKPAYINNLLKAIKCMSRYALEEEYTTTLLTQKIKNVREYKVLIHTFSEKEISKMIRFYSGSSFIDVRNRMILMMFFDTGIRVGELIRMKMDDIYDTHFVIYGKGRKQRIVPKGATIAKWMMKYLRVRQLYIRNISETDVVFPSRTGQPLTGEGIIKFMRKAADRVGINPLVRVSPHTCRHTFAHLQLKNGLDLYSLSRLLGHESVSITQRYLEAVQDSQILTAAKKTSVLENLR